MNRRAKMTAEQRDLLSKIKAMAEARKQLAAMPSGVLRIESFQNGLN